jgi:hemoglobin/transferrin/lactoferrin receptor protein
MKKLTFIYLVLLFFLFAPQTFTQILTVIDANTRQGIQGVVVYSRHPEYSVITNAKGQAIIDRFNEADSIYIRHVSYVPLTCGFSQLKASSFIIELTQSSFSLDEAIVSANRWEQGKTEIPYRIEKINMSETQFQNPQTAADLLGISGYAYIQKSQLAGGSPMLRGFATNRVLLVVDGVRMNNAIFRLGNVQNVISLDAGSTESAEILFGPGAVIYGSDAIGGVMDFHTLPAIYSENKKPLLSINAMGRYSTASNEKTGHLDFNAGFKKWAIVTSITYASYEDLRAGSHGNKYFLRPYYQQTTNGRDTIIANKNPEVQVGSGFNQYYIMQKISLRLSAAWDINYAFHYSSTGDAPRYDRLYLDSNGDGIFDNAEWYYGPQQWMMNRLEAKHSANNWFYDQMRLIAAWQDYEESRHDRKFNNQRLRNQTEHIDAYSVNIDMDKKIREKTNLFYGAEAVFNKVGSVANRININTHEITLTNTRYPDDAIWQAYGIYASMKHKINKQLILNTGMRYSYYVVKADFDTSMFPFPFVRAQNKNSALNGSIGVVFIPVANWQIYCNGSTGFHAPNVDDIGKVFDSEPGSVVVPNPGLKPEYAWNAEIGTSKTFGSLLKLDFSAYYTYLDHAFARRDFKYNGQDSILYDGEMSRVQAIQNITRAYVYGVQAEIDIKLGAGFGLNSILNFQHGAEQSEDSLIDYPLRHAAPLFGSTHLTYTCKNFIIDFYGIYNSKMDFDDLPLSERNDASPYAKDNNGNPYVPEWYTLNFKAAWYVNSYLSIHAGIENITDRLYRPYASGISAPGRNLIIAMYLKM